MDQEAGWTPKFFFYLEKELQKNFKLKIKASLNMFVHLVPLFKTYQFKPNSDLQVRTKSKIFLSLQRGIKGYGRANWSLAVTEAQKCLELPR